MARALGYTGSPEALDSAVSPRGFRLLAKVPRLPGAIIDRLVEHFGGLQKLLAASVDDLQTVDGVGEARARSVREGLSRLAESLDPGAVRLGRHGAGVVRRAVRVGAAPRRAPAGELHRSRRQSFSSTNDVCTVAEPGAFASTRYVPAPADPAGGVAHCGALGLRSHFTVYVMLLPAATR